MNKSENQILKDALEQLVAQVSAYSDVCRLQYPNVYPMMQILSDLSAECLELANSTTVVSKQENPLTKRELEVLSEVSRGLYNKEIAFNLGISTRTVEFHLKSVFNKLGVQGRTEAVVWAMEKGLLSG